MSEQNPDHITLVQIQTALLLPLTASFITDKLGIKPVHSEKRSQFWSRAQFTDICQALLQHITKMRNANFDAIEAKRPARTKKGGTPAAAPAQAAAPAAAGGFSFGALPGAQAPAASAPAAGGFSFGAPAAAPAPGGFSFGAPAAAPAPGGFSFGG